MFMILVVGFSWALSIILYPCVKFIFQGIEILSIKFKIWKEKEVVTFNETKILSNNIEQELILNKVKKEV